MLSGSLVAIVTPMQPGGALDFPALARLIDFHTGNGTSGIVIVGTTGESPTVNVDEMIAKRVEFLTAYQDAAYAQTYKAFVDKVRAVEAPLKASANSRHLRFCAHGMGLITHEAPRLTSTGPVPYEATDVDRPLEAGMVLSIETTLLHPKRGFIKLEDTVAVMDDGFEAFGDQGRGWNVVG